MCHPATIPLVLEFCDECVLVYPLVAPEEVNYLTTITLFIWFDDISSCQ